MFPPKGSGLELINNNIRKLLPQLKEYSNKMNSNIRPVNLPDPIQAVQSVQTMMQDLAANITASISEVAKRFTPEDYTAAAREFIPNGAKLLTPHYPKKSEAVLAADLDGDSRDELVASYKLNDPSVRTIILKKTDNRWHQAAEIVSPEYEDIHYRNSGDLAGTGKGLLLLGLASKAKERTLFGYALDDNGAVKLFSRNYHMLDVQGLTGDRKSSAGARIALWNEDEENSYNIELLRWNGLQLEPQNTYNYYTGNVIPYLVRKVKGNPRSASSWYCLSDALVKAGMRKDAETAIEYGMKQDGDAGLKDRFLQLKSRL